MNKTILAKGIKFGIREEYGVEYSEQMLNQYVSFTEIDLKTVIRGIGVCDEYIAVFDVKQYASDMDCFQPLMEKFNRHYVKYPEYPVADAGYGSLNNYLFCKEHGMEKYMKFTMFAKETTDKKYHNDPYRAVNFPIDENGNPVCPNGKKFYYLKSNPIKGNRYGRIKELYQCEDCTDCPHKPQCCKCKWNRIVRLNEELTNIHQEVLGNLNSAFTALCRE